MLYLVTSKDKYELPVMCTDKLLEIAIFLGSTYESVRTAVYKGKNIRNHKIFKVEEIDE